MCHAASSVHLSRALTEPHGSSRRPVPRSGDAVSGVGASAARDLTSRFSGELIWPGEGRYDVARVPFNPRWSKQPALIARCRHNTDVIAALTWASEHGQEIAVRSTGHHYGGFSSTDGVVVDLSLMRGVRVDVGSGTARIGGGAISGDLQTAAWRSRLGAPTGVMPSTGVGLLVGGGSGWIRNRAGWSADNILSADLVTADGRVVRASVDDHADLLWAVRGAGANFGVITSLDIQLYPMPARVLAGSMLWCESRAQAGLRAVRDVAAQASDELALLPLLKVDDHSGSLAPELRGMLILEVLFCHSGPEPTARRELDTWRNICPPDLESAGPQGFPELHHWMETPPSRRTMDAYSVLRLTDDLIARLCEVVRRTACRGSRRQLEVFDQRGGLSRSPALPSAQARRPATTWSIRPQTTYDDPALDAANDQWLDEVLEIVRAADGAVEDACLTNTLSRRAGQARLRASFGDQAYERLAWLKRTWDPDNVFRHTQAISPQPTSSAAPATA
jgi:FAD/FMN-containing dehydrogenase